jgi:RNA polymerase sigma-70 factor (ECF subfamily)
MGEDHRQRLMSWVGSEVLPHEADLRKWLRRTVGDTDAEDIIQDSYCRISDLADIRHIRSGKAYFFQVAKSIVLDRMRRARVVSIETIAEIDALGVVQDEPSPERVVAGRHELSRVISLIATLPDRCRRIFELRKVQGLSQREVAQIMGVPETTVENDVVKGLRLILRAIAEEDRDTDRTLANFHLTAGSNERTRDRKRD